MNKLTTPLRIIVVLCALELFSYATLPQVYAQSKPFDLTNSIWAGMNDDLSFVLTFSQGKAEQKVLAATLKGWGDDLLELRGEYSEAANEPRVQLAGSYQGERMILDLKLDPGDHEQPPFLHGQFTAGSNTVSFYAACNKQCPVNNSAQGARNEAPNFRANDLLGNWQDTSGAIGFKEYWSIKLVEGVLVVSGKFTKGEEVVGSFQSSEALFDAKKGVLSFQQIFEQKPDDSWLDSNDVEASVQGDSLKIKIRGIEATLTRTPAS